MFRPSDARRVQAAFDTDLIPPYEAVVTLEADFASMRAVIADPLDPNLTVAQAIWWHDANAISEKQPAEAEIGVVVHSMMVACSEYPARKAAEAIETAEREARQAALMAAKQAEAEA